MPFIDSKITVAVDAAKKEELKAELGKLMATLHKSETYLMVGIEDKYDGKWTDMSEMKDSLIERAYSQLNEKLGSKETFTSISLDSKDTFTIDNYPIKAILAPNK